MINNHRDILNLWPNTATLVKRIGQEFPNLSPADLKAVGHVLRNAKHRNKLTSGYWKYLIRVSAGDYENNRIAALVTANLLMDMAG